MNIYVSNLNYSTASNSLQDLFADFGEVSSTKVITDRETGRSRGFAFVEMSDDAAGQNAINSLNNSNFEGSTINVSIARPRVDRSNSGYNNNRY